MKKLTFLMLAITLTSCTGNVQHPDFENNKMLGQRLFQLHGEENYDAIKDMYHDDLSWRSPKYGEGLVDKETQLGYVKMYQDMYEDIYFKANYWLPDVDTLSLKNDGSVRVFGTWSGTEEIILDQGGQAGEVLRRCLPIPGVWYGVNYV